MQTEARLTQSLLGIIALCLVLIVLRLYGIPLTPIAEAAPQDVQKVIIVDKYTNKTANVDGNGYLEVTCHSY